jgi:lysyl-tRNA synthetase class 2
MAEKRKFTQQEQVRRQKLEELANLGIDPFGQKYDVETYTSDIRREYGSCTKEELAEKKVSVQIAGRIIRRRRKGKVCFMDLLDRDGSIQLYVRKDVVGEEIYEIVKRGDLGDIIGVKGELMVTDMGELTVRVDEYTHLSKALRPLPEKFHGLTDTEERFRRRYVDLIMNEEARKVAFTRPKIIRSIQNYLDSKHFVEVETPIMNNILGGAAAKPFVTHFNALDSDFYLRIATELNLKRLIVGGMDAVYEIGRLFRNEGMDRTHNPEFTTIEVYKAFSDLEGMMDLTEGIIANSAMTVNGTYDIEYKGHKISLAP